MRSSTEGPNDSLHLQNSSSSASFEDIKMPSDANDAEKQNINDCTELSILKDSVDQEFERVETETTKALPFSDANNPKNETSDQEISSGIKCLDDTRNLEEKIELIEFNHDHLGSDLELQAPVEVTKESSCINGVGEFIGNSNSSPKSPPSTNQMVLSHESSENVAMELSPEVPKEDAIINEIDEVTETSICGPETPPSTGPVEDCHETCVKNEEQSSFEFSKENTRTKNTIRSPQSLSQDSIDMDPTILETSTLSEANDTKDGSMEELSDNKDWSILEKTSESFISDGQDVVESLVQEMLNEVTKFERNEEYIELVSSTSQEVKGMQPEILRDDKSGGVEASDATSLSNEFKLELKGSQTASLCENDALNKREDSSVQVETKERIELCDGKSQVPDRQSIFGSPKTFPDLQNYPVSIKLQIFLATPLMNFSIQDNLLPRVSLLRLKKLSSKPFPGVCSSCSQTVMTNDDALMWETMIFCNIQCIGRISIFFLTFLN